MPRSRRPLPRTRRRAPRALALVAGVLALLAVLAAGCRPAGVPPTPGPYMQHDATADGTGKVYMGREISKVMGHEGSAWLERPEREVTELPDRVIDALSLDSASVVADIGAGTGYFTFRIAPRVPQGRVYAVDIEPAMLRGLTARRDSLGLPNVIPVESGEADPRLRPASIDVALIVDAYHEFAFPREMGEAIVEALRPGGRLVLVEYRGEDATVAIKPLHKMTVAQVQKEMEAVGLRLRERLDVLPQQHLLVFEKPEAAR